MAVHCPECGFVNPDAANYCARCGAFIGDVTGAVGGSAGANERTTITYRVDPSGELRDVEAEGATGATLVIRAGGGRVGESFALQGERLTIGRRPDSDIFLDDVTVSRDHALLVQRGHGYALDDCGSLNGTYVNRHRVDSHDLSDGDELQIGKYKLSYLAHG